jgi:uncharacterized damage-inducible protein DinB
MHPVAFFDEVTQHRGTLLDRFREAPPQAFHQPIVEDTWSCEALFRHLLAGYKWMMDALPAAPPTGYHPLAVNAREWPDRHVSLDDVEQGLDFETLNVRGYLEQVSPEEWKQQVQDDPPLTLEACIYGLLGHEIEHHGMIRWILKRYSGWDDNQMVQAEIP